MGSSQSSDQKQRRAKLTLRANAEVTNTIVLDVPEYAPTKGR